MGKTTDELISLAEEISPCNPAPRDGHAADRGRAHLDGAGLHGARRPTASQAASFTGSQAGIITDTRTREPRSSRSRPDRIREALDDGLVPVVAGFQGVSTDATSRPSAAADSDVTAVALAAALRRTLARSTPT